MTHPRFAVLGPVRAWRDGAELPLGPPQQHTVLTLLLVRLGRPVTVDELADFLWADDPPAGAASVVHKYLGALRRLFAPGLLVRDAGGYRLDLPPEFLDLTSFRRLANTGDQLASRPSAAAEAYAAALRLWRGRCAAGVRAARRDVLASVDEEYSATARKLAVAALASHATAAMTTLLREAAERDLTDQALQARIMPVLAAAGAQTEAMDLYQRVLAALSARSIRPGAELRAAYQALLGPSDVRPRVPPAVAPTVERLAVPPAQLPPRLSTFTGRARELATLRAGHGGQRPGIVVIDGMAGIGKSALAVEWAHDIAHRYPDGQLYADLHGGGAVQPADLVLRGFLVTLGIAVAELPQDVEARTLLYRELLAGRKMLVVLDNVNDVAQVRPLLPASRDGDVIVTARARLTGLIEDGAGAMTLGPLSDDSARTFLTGRLGRHRIAAHPAAVTEIVSQCGGLPLALSVAAARAEINPGLPLDVVAGQLHDPVTRLDAFAVGDPATDVRAAFAASYRLLGPVAARLFRSLSVHDGPEISLALATAIAGIAEPRVRPLLTELTDARLLVRHDDASYGRHSLVAAYAAELSGSEESVSERAESARRLREYLAVGHRRERA